MSLADQIAIHVEDLNNPHQDNKVNIGLGNIDNFGIATEAEAKTLTTSDKYLTPLMLKHVFDGILMSKGIISPTGTPLKIIRSDES